MTTTTAHSAALGDETRRLYAQGLTQDQIATRLGVSRPTVRKHLDGVPRRNALVEAANELAAAARSLREQGLTQPQIAAELNVSVSAAANYLNGMRPGRRAAVRFPERVAAAAAAGARPDPGWQARAACATADPAVFFGSGSGVNADRRAAAAFCTGCPVRRDCLLHALTHSETGMWAGTSRNERNALRKNYLSQENPT